MTYGNIVDPSSKRIIDEVLCVYMKSPKTYTMEDVVEINCHGGMVPLRKTLELVLSNGARMAEPGEFTKRAFLNGRLDLSQAEAVIDVIKAKTDRNCRKYSHWISCQSRGYLRQRLSYSGQQQGALRLQL